MNRVLWVSFAFALGAQSSFGMGVLSKFTQPKNPPQVGNAQAHVSSSVPTAPPEVTQENSAALAQWCSEVKRSTDQFKWNLDPCTDLSWNIGGQSVQQRPLVYVEYGDAKAENTTLVLSMVHGDEITPLYLALQLARWAKENQEQLKGTHLIIAPLVNPDGYFKSPRTRMNARGVDVNRNFETQDWHTKALQIWKGRLRSDRRRFPGHKPRSEPETLFQEDLIKRFRPQKILSIHSPLNHLDYDGPFALTLSRSPKDYAREWVNLHKKLRAVSAGFFPGSLGNFAGYELEIPTWTKELRSANPSKAAKYWKESLPEMRTLIQFSLPEFATKLYPKLDSKFRTQTEVKSGS